MQLFRRVRSSSAALLLALGAASCASSAPPRSDDPPVFPANPLTTVVGQAGAVTIDLRTTPAQPPTRGVIDVLLVVRDRDGAPVDGASIDVVPWMDSHGHGTSTTPAVTPQGNGRYWVRDVSLFMPGQWELRIALSGAVSDRAAAKLDVQ